MQSKMTAEEVHAFWTTQVRTHGESPAASWSDRMVIEMEIREILQWLEPGDKVLDVGCGNGYSTVRFAAAKAVRILGVDYVDEMIREAQRRGARMKESLAGGVEFKKGDARQLNETDNAFDKVVVIRVIINVGKADVQLQALRECSRVLKPGGLLLLSEATMQGWHRLNEFRREWGLEEIPMPSFNRYLDEQDVIRAVADRLEIVKCVNFASTYYAGTRVLKPLLIRALGLAVDASNPEMCWNRWFAELPAWGDYGTQKLFVFRKT